MLFDIEQHCRWMMLLLLLFLLFCDVNVKLSNGQHQIYFEFDIYLYYTIWI